MTKTFCGSNALILRSPQLSSDHWAAIAYCMLHDVTRAQGLHTVLSWRPWDS